MPRNIPNIITTDTYILVQKHKYEQLRHYASSESWYFNKSPEKCSLAEV